MQKLGKREREKLTLPVGMWLTISSEVEPSDFQMALCYRGTVGNRLVLNWKGHLGEEAFSSWGFFPRRGELALPIDVKKACIFMRFIVRKVSGLMLVLEGGGKEKMRKYESNNP